MTTTRIYIVKAKDGDSVRLVRAAHPSNALRYVADNLFTVAVASGDDLEELLPKGVKVEKIKHEQQQLT